MYSQELYELMESEYRKRGASNNAAQITLRENHLKSVLQSRGEEEEEVKDMIPNDFDAYHFFRG